MFYFEFWGSPPKWATSGRKKPTRGPAKQRRQGGADGPHGPWPIRPHGGRGQGGLAAPLPPPPCLVPHGGANKEGSPLPPIYTSATWGF